MSSVAPVSRSWSTRDIVVTAALAVATGISFIVFDWVYIVGQSLVGGIALGVGGGALVGFALYFGLLRIPLQHFFSVTNAMLILLAAGLASAAAGFLVQSDLLPAWGAQVWDTSHILSDDSVLGRTLGILIGYKAAPAGIQIAFYLTTVALFTAGVLWQRRRASVRAAAPQFQQTTIARPQH